MAVGAPGCSLSCGSAASHPALTVVLPCTSRRMQGMAAAHIDAVVALGPEAVLSGAIVTLDAAFIATSLAGALNIIPLATTLSATACQLLGQARERISQVKMQPRCLECSTFSEHGCIH